MSESPEELKYVETHEWVREEGDGTVIVGITDYAQGALGDVVYVSCQRWTRKSKWETRLP